MSPQHGRAHGVQRVLGCEQHAQLEVTHLQLRAVQLQRAPRGGRRLRVIASWVGVMD